MRHSLICSALVVAAACSSDPPAKPHGTVSSSSARSSVSSLNDVSSAMASGNASAAASGVMALTAAGESAIATGSTARIDVPDRWPSTHIAESFTGSAICTPDSCTFDHYGDADQYGSYEINGTISRSGDTLAFDLTLDVATAGSTLHWEIDGSLTATPSLIDGSVHSHGTASESGSGGYSLTWDVAVDFNAIGLDPSGCPVSGSLSAEVSLQEGASTYAAAGSVTFGPACGDVTAK